MTIAANVNCGGLVWNVSKVRLDSSLG